MSFFSGDPVPSLLPSSKLEDDEQEKLGAISRDELQSAEATQVSANSGSESSDGSSSDKENKPSDYTKTSYSSNYLGKSVAKTNENNTKNVQDTDASKINICIQPYSGNKYSNIKKIETKVFQSTPTIPVISNVKSTPASNLDSNNSLSNKNEIQTGVTSQADKLRSTTDTKMNFGSNGAYVGSSVSKSYSNSNNVTSNFGTTGISGTNGCSGSNDISGITGFRASSTSGSTGFSNGSTGINGAIGCSSGTDNINAEKNVSSSAGLKEKELNRVTSFRNPPVRMA